MSDSDAPAGWTEERCAEVSMKAAIEKALLEVQVGGWTPTMRELLIMTACVGVGVTETLIQIRRHGNPERTP